MVNNKIVIYIFCRKCQTSAIYDSFVIRDAVHTLNFSTVLIPINTIFSKYKNIVIYTFFA